MRPAHLDQISMSGKARPLESASCLADTEQLQLGSSLHRPSAGRLQIAEIEDVEGPATEASYFPLQHAKVLHVACVWTAYG